MHITKPAEPTSSSVFHTNQNPSTNSFVMGVKKPRNVAEKSAAAFWKNLLGIRFISGTSEQEHLSNESFQKTNTTPSTTVTSLIASGKQKFEQLKPNRDKREKEKCMSFWRENQKTRRERQRVQAGIPHPLQTVPPLPINTTSY